MRRELQRIRVLCRGRSFAEVLEPRCLLSAAQSAAAPVMLLNGQSGMAAEPADAALAPDGSLWYVRNNAIERLSIDGKVSTFAVPLMTDGTPRAVVSDIVFAPDESAWFMVSGVDGNHVEKVAADGSISDISPAVNAQTWQMLANTASMSTPAEDSSSPAAAESATDLMYVGGGVMVNASVAAADSGQLAVSADFLNALVVSSSYQTEAMARSPVTTVTTPTSSDGSGVQNSTGGSHEAPAPAVPIVLEAAPVTTMPVVEKSGGVAVDAAAPPAVQAAVPETQTASAAPAAPAAPASAAQPKESITPTDAGATDNAAALAPGDDPGTFEGEFCVGKRAELPAYPGVPVDHSRDTYSAGPAAEPALAMQATQTPTGAITLGATGSGQAKAILAAAQSVNQDGTAQAQGATANSTMPAVLADGSGVSRLHKYTRWWNAAVCLCVATGLQLWSGGKGRRFYVWAYRRESK